MQNQTIIIKEISKKYGRKQVLSEISLTAEPGSCIGILGLNGCGKSTLLSILGGTNRPGAGSFTWGDHDLFREKALRRQMVGYVPQGTPLFEELSALDNLRLWYSAIPENPFEKAEASGKYGRPAQKDREKDQGKNRESTLERDLREGIPALLGVNDFLSVPVKNMSGGMKKRLAISCACAHDPMILLLDEPSAALDLGAKERIGSYLRYQKSRGGTILLATHDEQELPLCDRLYIMKEGRLVPYVWDGNIHRLAGLL